MELTPRELQILKMIKDGNSSKAIAEVLTISSNTVDNHRANMIKKLGLSGKNALLMYAIRNT